MRFRLNAFLLVVNVAVLAAGSYFLLTRPPSAPLPGKEQSNLETETIAEAPEASVAVVTNEVVVTNRWEWRQLESEDYHAYIARLREIGCPEQTIRDIIIADLDKLFAPRAQGLKGRRGELKYWHPEEEELANNLDERELTKQQRAIEKEKRLAFEELLGVDLVRERLKQRGQDDYYERRLSFLPEDKRGPVRRLLEEYDEREQDILRKEEDGEWLGPAEQAQLRKLREERDSQMAAMLTPDEAQQYELWLSPTANAVRQSVYGMDATEEEFLKVYHLRRAFDEAWSQVDTASLAEDRLAAYQQAQAELEGQLMAQLGERRYADLKRGEDPDFHHLNAVVSRFRLPREKAGEVYELKRSIQAMRQAVHQDPRLTPEQRKRVLEEMNVETERIARSLLGERAFGAYLRRGQAQWLRD